MYSSSKYRDIFTLICQSHCENKCADGLEQAGSINMCICLYLHLYIYYSETYIVVFYDIKFQTKALGAEVLFF